MGSESGFSKPDLHIPGLVKFFISISDHSNLHGYNMKKK